MVTNSAVRRCPSTVGTSLVEVAVVWAAVALGSVLGLALLAVWRDDSSMSSTRRRAPRGQQRRRRGRDVLEQEVEPVHQQRWWRQQHGPAWLGALAALITALVAAWALWDKQSPEVTITSVQVQHSQDETTFIVDGTVKAMPDDSYIVVVGKPPSAHNDQERAATDGSSATAAESGRWFVSEPADVYIDRHWIGALTVAAPLSREITIAAIIINRNALGDPSIAASGPDASAVEGQAAIRAVPIPSPSTSTTTTLPSPIVSITDPLDGQSVPISIAVRGTAYNVGSNQKIWVFFKYRNGPFIPMNAARIQPDGDWSSSISVRGLARYREWFDIVAAIVTNDQAEDVLRDHRCRRDSLRDTCRGLSRLPEGYIGESDTVRAIVR